jgi:hypothetical protein
MLAGLFFSLLPPLFLACKDLVHLSILIKYGANALLVPYLPIVLDLLCPLGHQRLPHEFLRNSDICMAFVGWTKET